VKLEDIARLAGVSKATVSSVLNGRAEKYRIKAETQERVRALAEQHGYRPNHSAAALRVGKSRAIGFIVPDFENRSYLRIAKRLESFARQAGYQMIIASSDDDPATEAESARLLVARGVDALLVSTCLTDDVSLYTDMLARGIPVIALDRPLPERFSTILSDDIKGARELTCSLDLSRVREVVLLGALPALQVSQWRETGFRQALEAFPAIRPWSFHGPHFDAASGRQTLLQARAALGRYPDAIVTTAYNLLEGVIEHLHEEGLLAAGRTPGAAGDGSMAGDGPIQMATFGNSRLLDFLPLAVNSLPQQYDLIAEAAWKLALQAIEPAEQSDSAADQPRSSVDQPRQIVIPRQLQLRTQSWSRPVGGTHAQ